MWCIEFFGVGSLVVSRPMLCSGERPRLTCIGMVSVRKPYMHVRLHIHAHKGWTCSLPTTWNWIKVQYHSQNPTLICAKRNAAKWRKTSRFQPRLPSTIWDFRIFWAPQLRWLPWQMRHKSYRACHSDNSRLRILLPWSWKMNLLIVLANAFKKW